MNKPPYKVQTVKEIIEAQKKPYNMVSTFSGCGGSCFGMEMAGFNVRWANEFIRAARETYNLNHKGVILDGSDIRKVKGEEILKLIGLKQGELDLFEGSPPCSDFSMSGKRKGGINTIEMKGWGREKKYSDTYQQVDDLFFEFARVLKELQPKVFIAENVKGLTIGHAAKLLGSPQLGFGSFDESQSEFFDDQDETIYHQLTNCGYQVRFKVLNAQFYEVPQSRERLFFIGVRNDISLTPVYPEPFNYIYTVREAIPWIENDSENPFEVEKEAQIERFDIGNKWDEIKPGQSHPERFNLTKPNIDRPSPTIVQSAGNSSAASIVHPLIKRKFSVAELRRLSSFPDDFQLTGTYQQKVERIGRAVPPHLMKYLGLAIQEHILDKLPKNQTVSYPIAKKRKKVLIIGQSFSTIRVSGTPAFSNDYSGKRLRQWFDFEDLETFNQALKEGYYLTTNLVLKEKDNISESEIDRERLKRTIIDFKPDMIVLVGSKARDYILKQFKIPSNKWIHLPHPSTKNKFAEGKDGEIIEKLSSLGLRYNE